MNEHFDVIIIGTGASGGTFLHRLAASGKRILLLERGPFLPHEKGNWSYHGSFKGYSSEVMFNKDGGEIRPGYSYHCRRQNEGLWRVTVPSPRHRGQGQPRFDISHSR